jgi:helix-turn-helix protein
MVRQGHKATLVAATLEISRSSLYYRKKPRGSRADREHVEQIVIACGDKPVYGYRRVAWWLRRKENLVVNRKRVLRVMRERGLLVRSRRLRARRKKEWGRVEAAEPNQIWQSDTWPWLLRNRFHSLHLEAGQPVLSLDESGSTCRKVVRSWMPLQNRPHSEVGTMNSKTSIRDLCHGDHSLTSESAREWSRFS